ncbi:MAG TPA: DUF971 domain-containing protein [Polyangiales bacterium]|jgi:DUF971 family protein|nr:DUF971 domain-containing protein [Polyangiales bacterium]
MNESHDASPDTNSPSITPLEVRAPRGGRVMEIDFADGHRAVYPHEILRGYCPCAVCQGHSGPIRFVPGGNEELVELAEVGDYALRMSWGDGHATGIYTFSFLRDLCSCSDCNRGDEAKKQSFRRG